MISETSTFPGTPNERIWPGYSELPATQRVSFVNHPYNKIGNRFPPTLLSKQVSFTYLQIDSVEYEAFIFTYIASDLA